MIAVNFTEFKTGLKSFLDEVEGNNEIFHIQQKTGKGTVLMSMQEYNSIMETIHLMSSRKNANRLFESIRQMKDGEKVENSLIED